MAGFEKMFVGGTDNKAKEIKSILKTTKLYYEN